jgi:hypothetical protein
MQQEKIPENPEEMTTHEKPAQGSGESFSYTRREIIFTMCGALCVVFLSLLDQTIVGTALPHIAADLQGFDVIVWVSTATCSLRPYPFPFMASSPTCTGASLSCYSAL